jgi:hypothetical protein
MEKIVLIGSDMLLLNSIRERLPNNDVECLSHKEAEERGFTKPIEIKQPLELSALGVPMQRRSPAWEAHRRKYGLLPNA